MNLSFATYILSTKDLYSFRALDSEMRSDRLGEHQEKASDISKNILTNSDQLFFIDSFFEDFNL